ncbi:hypothetical protein [Coraliomargarita parva]|uniref:hypothetical protein n=1 Tax=Coraliomargarita parva TaxID=3014050 RepID=UPI0022B5267A|nr:hypothetical protein [Coraliomargarita parva]
MIHILTQNPAMREQLSALLQELDHEFVFHDAVEPLVKAVRKLSKQDHVFYDLQLEDVLWAFERLYTACKRTNLVAFERMTNETSLEYNQCPAGVENYLLLPAHPERAKNRLQSVLREVAQKTTARKTVKKKKAAGKAKPKATGKQAAKAKAKADADSQVEAPAPTIARYLQARSGVMRELLSDIQIASDKASIVVIEGEEGAEFELLAREINFRSNGDATPLHVVDPMQLHIPELMELLKASEGKEGPQFLYLGQTVDWTAKAADEIEQFIEQYDASDNKSLRLIFSYAEDSDSYTADAVRPLVKTLRKRSQGIQLPGMAEREEDIPMIAHTVFSTLRMAHPFLRTRVLSNDAISYLQSEAENMDYCRLTRIIRNAMALSKQDIIGEETVRNLSDDSPMTQHLIESLADERYFRTAGD